MSNWLKKFGSKLFIYLTAFVLSFILIFVIVFTIILGNVKNNVKNSFTNVEKVFQNLSTDTINDNYNLFLEGIVDVETNAMEYVINDYTNQLNYLSDLISTIYKEDQLDGGSFFGIPGEIDTSNRKINYYFYSGVDKESSEIKKEVSFLSSIEDFLYYSIKDSMQMTNCFFITENNITVIATKDKNEYKFDNDMNYLLKDSTWYKEAIATNSVIMTAVGNDYFSGRKVLSLIKAVRSDDKVLGVVGFDWFLDQMTFKNMGVTAIDTFNLFIIDGNGQLLFNARGNNGEDINDYGESVKSFVSKALNDEVGTGYYNYDGNRYRTFYKKVEGTNLTLFTSIRDERLVVMADSLNASLKSENEQLLTSIYKDTNKMYIYLIIVLVIVMLIIFFIANHVSKKMSEPLRELSDVLDTAKKIQQNMLPKKFSEITNRKDIDLYAINIPEAEVGGDFYNYIINGNALILVIADVSGSGIPAALFMARANALLNTAIKLSDSPKAILSYVNYELCKNNKDNYFVTMALYYIDLETKKVISANSGHEDSIIIKSNGEVIVNKENRCAPLGIVDHNNYIESEFTLEPDDKLFLYTDGVVEAINSSEELYGINRLIDNLKKVHNKNSKEIIDYVNESISDYSKGLEQYDDITMLCFKINDIYIDERLIYNFEKEFDAKYECIDEIDELIKEKLSIVYSNDVTKFKDELETIYVCIEELIVNIVDYAYKNREGNNKILIKLVIDKNLDKLSISFIDSGKEFDPTKLADPNILASVDNRKVGGLGVYITKQKMDVMEYKYENGKNCLTITKYL